MAQTIYMVQNDTGPPVEFEAKNPDGTARDLTGATVRFKIKHPTNGTRTNDTGTQNQCVITDAVNGKCRYDFAAGQVPDVGMYNCDLEITDSAGRVETEYKITRIKVRAEN